MPRTRTLAALPAALACAALAAAPAGAVVPPTDCGRMTLDGRRYQVKVDQITCAQGRAYTRAFVLRRTRPSGYTCRTFPVKRGRVRFSCAAGRRLFFGILR